MLGNIDEKQLDKIQSDVNALRTLKQLSDERRCFPFNVNSMICHHLTVTDFDALHRMGYATTQLTPQSIMGGLYFVPIRSTSPLIKKEYSKKRMSVQNLADFGLIPLKQKILFLTTKYLLPK